MKQLSEKHKLFARVYAATRNARQAAALSGIRRPEKAGYKLLEDQKIQAEINRLCEKRTPSGEVAAGLRRIAFGSVSDAVKLLLCPDGLDIDSLDLYCVSEIKISKGGGMEIKFFDRIKALSQLGGAVGAEENTASSFVEALRRGAEKMGEDEF